MKFTLEINDEPFGDIRIFNGRIENEIGGLNFKSAIFSNENDKEWSFDKLILMINKAIKEQIFNK